MTTISDSDHCKPTKASRDDFAEASDFTKQLNSEIDLQASFSENETVEDATVSSEDSTVGVELKQIKESSFSKEIENSGDDDVYKIDEVDETEKAFQQVEQECLAPNGKEISNLELSEAQRLLEAEKNRLLAEIEHGSIFGKSVDLEKTMERVEIKDNSIDNRSMEVELIDDIALIDVVPFNKKSNDYDTKRRGTALNDKDVPRKHTKIGEKKPTDKGNASNVVEGNVSAKVSEIHILRETNGRILYSREQLELMRFANIVKQRELWSEMYARLLPEVVTEYESLVCLKNQKTSKPNRRQRESRIGDNLGSDEGTEDLTPENYVDDNDDYNSILKPAFEVEGEPDFSTGPPEDGLEYLRRVRWEAKGIPNVRVAKVDERKYKKKEQSVYMPLIPEIPKCPANLLPIKEWEDLLLSDFLHLRQALSENTYWGEDEIISSQSGEDLLVEIFNKRPHTVKDESLGEVVSNIQGMDSVTRISNLKKRVCLVEKESGLQSSDCKWVVALCASLETPLDADTSACLRSLLRKCASVRAEKSLDVGDEEVIMANMLITIAGRYFGQMGH